VRGRGESEKFFEEGGDADLKRKKKEKGGMGKGGGANFRRGEKTYKKREEMGRQSLLPV